MPLVARPTLGNDWAMGTTARYFGAVLAFVSSSALYAISCSSKPITHGASAETTDASAGTSGVNATSEASGSATSGNNGSSGASGNGGVGGSTAGASGGAGTSGASGSAGTTMCPAACTPGACTPTSPPAAALTDFSFVPDQIFSEMVDAGVRAPMWWTKFWGGMYLYPAIPGACSDAAVPAFPLTQDFSAGSWHVSGVVGDYSGFGIYLEPCMIDLSAYTSISFTIGGIVGATGELTFGVASSEDDEPNKCWTNVGTCTPDAGMCRSPHAQIAVPATPGTVTVHWTDLTGGVPTPTLNTTQVTGFNFAFDCGSCLMTPYPVDLTIDDVTLL